MAAAGDSSRTRRERESDIVQTTSRGKGTESKESRGWGPTGWFKEWSEKGTYWVSVTTTATVARKEQQDETLYVYVTAKLELKNQEGSWEMVGTWDDYAKGYGQQEKRQGIPTNTPSKP